MRDMNRKVKLLVTEGMMVTPAFLATIAPLLGVQPASLTTGEKKFYEDINVKDFGVNVKDLKTGDRITNDGYTKGSLAQNQPAITSEVIEITIPKGERLANMTPSGSSTMSYNELLKRRRSFGVAGIKSIILNGIPRTKITAKLLPKTEGTTVTTTAREFTNKEEVQAYLTDTFGKVTFTYKQKEILQNPDKLNNVNEKLEAYRDVNSDLINSSTKKDITELDDMFKTAKKIEAPMVVYVPLTETELRYEINSFRPLDKEGQQLDSTKISEESFDDLKHNFKYGIINTFRNASVVKREGSSQNIILKLIVPKGTLLMYIDGDEILLPREQGITI